MAEWRPFERQEFALQRTEYEILFGGSRGGGKTDSGLVWLTDHIDHPRYKALVIRKNADDLSDWVDRARYFYNGLGATVAYRPAIITFPSGATIRTGHLKDDQSYTKYQGHEYQQMLIEELTQIPDEKRYLQLIASCRSTIAEIRPQIFLTTNPGGPGHIWVKNRFVDPAPPDTPFTADDTGRSRIYIPATIEDNPILQEMDPDYVKFLDGLKDKDYELWRAWRHGDWNTFAGQYFREFTPETHVVTPFIPNKDRFISFHGGLDWGRVAPFAFVVAGLQLKEHEGQRFYRLWVFDEVYGTDKTPKEWGQIIKEHLDFYRLKLSNLNNIESDTQIFTTGLDKSKSIRDQFIDADEEYMTTLKPASKDRIGGWENLHNWFSMAPDGMPYMVITKNCTNLIREIPGLIHDEKKVEDTYQDAGVSDHIADALRYLCKSLKWIDAKVGGVGKTAATRMLEHTAEMREEKQIGIDIDLFSK